MHEVSCQPLLQGRFGDERAHCVFRVFHSALRSLLDVTTRRARDSAMAARRNHPRDRAGNSFLIPSSTGVVPFAPVKD